MNDDETQIVWKLPKGKKGRYVAASRAAGKSLVQWLADVCDAASEPIGDDQGKGRSGDVAQSARNTVDGGG